MEDEFWLWVSSWALFITKPSDINPDYSDEGYVLPPLEVRWHELPVHYGDAEDKNGQISLFEEAAAGLKEAAQVKRESINQRVEKMKALVDASPEDHFVLWHDLESERYAIKKKLPETVEIYGSQDYDLREQRVIDFSEGKTRLFATKKSLQDLAAISNDIATERYFWELIMNSTILSKQYTGVIGSCKRSRSSLISFIWKMNDR